MYYNKVEISGVNTAKLKVLKESEKMELLKKARAGDKKARDELVTGNLRLVLSVIQRFANRGENPDDLFQVGCIGLIKAIDNFDLSYDVKFSTYAVPMILGEIKRYIRDNSSIRVSRSLKDIAYKSMKYIDEYYSEHGTEPTIDAIASKLGVNSFDVSNALNAMREPVSMYEPIYNDGGDTIFLYDQIEDKSAETDVSNRLSIENAISDLDSREKYILNQRFVIGKTQMEVADELDISQAQVSRLEKKAVKELKKVLK